MKKKLWISLAMALVTSSFLCFGQQKTPTVMFETESHDFGKIKEADGPAVFNFIFRNTGGSPLILTNVQASCGCTTPSWSKEPIMPGAKGTITVSYNPQNKPGSFSKDITVTSNAEPAKLIIKISGEVIQRQIPIEETYPTNFDGFRLKTNQITFQSISPDKKQSSAVEVYNNTDKPMNIKFSEVPSYISIKISSNIIEAKGKGLIDLTYDASVKNDWGPVFDRIAVIVNDKDNANNRLSITANIQDNFNALTPEQILNAAKIDVDNANFNFGVIKPGDKAAHDFVIKNTGKSDLLIHKVQPSCGCTIATLKSNVLKPGESTTVSISFDSKGKDGAIEKYISIFSNDPTKPSLALYIKGTIQL